MESRSRSGQRQLFTFGIGRGISAANYLVALGVTIAPRTQYYSLDYLGSVTGSVTCLDGLARIQALAR